MRVLLAGATGAVGRRLLPLMVEAGHHVVATSRSAAAAQTLARAGAEPAVMDGLDAASVERVVRDARPEVIVHQMSALAAMGSNLRKFDADFALTNRLRTEGTDHLIAAAGAAGVKRLVVQSYTGWPNARSGGPVKTEDDPLDPTPTASSRRTLAGIRHLESTVTSAGGIDGLVLRYGSLYGPGTSLGRDGSVTDLVRHRRMPVVGDGGGIWSFLHIDDAAGATLAAIERGDTGVYNVVDDDPAPVRDWLPYLAAAIGARPPRHVPVWLGRALAGEHAVSVMTQVRGSSNAMARRELEWVPRWTTWRRGFEDGL
jgi:nucleoside-diphosphate-sugar epimerase